MVAFFPVTPSQLATTMVISSRFFAGPMLKERPEVSSIDEADVSMSLRSGRATGVDVADGRVDADGDGSGVRGGGFWGVGEVGMSTFGLLLKIEESRFQNWGMPHPW